VIGFLVDEMFPIAAAATLRDTYGHDAVHVAEVELQATDDTQVAAAVRAQGRAVVTENVADFATARIHPQEEPAAGGGQAAALAKVLDLWAQTNPDPYLGPHWPQSPEHLDVQPCCHRQASRRPESLRREYGVLNEARSLWRIPGRAAILNSSSARSAESEPRRCAMAGLQVM
jgi:Domain of unknown function (DUF5615)